MIKKLISCDNKPFTVKHTAGGTVFKFSSGMYELFRKCVYEQYSSYQEDTRFHILHHVDKDESGKVFRETFKVMSQENHQYTLNMFHTTSTSLVNGPSVIE